MDMRFSAALLWRGPVLAAAAWMLTACATEMGEVQTPPASPVASPAPTTPPPAPPAPSPVVVVTPPPVAPLAEPAPVSPAPPTPPPTVSSPPLDRTVQGPIEVTGVEVQDMGAGGLALLVTGDGPITTYESFTLADPPRLVVDIPNAVHAVPQPISARPPLVKAIRSSQYRERPVQVVRVVFDLRSALPYRVVTARNQLRVDLGAAAGTLTNPTPPVATSAPFPTAPAASAKPAGKVSRVDLQNVRGRQQILIRTTGPVMYTVTENSDPLGLSIDVTGATVEPAASRTVDLRQVASPVSRLQTSQRQTAPDPVVRVVADLRGPTRYDVRQTPSAIVVEFLNPPRAAQVPAVRAATVTAAAPRGPVLATPTALAASLPAAQPAVPGTGRLSMDFKDADINNLLRIIAEVSGMNVVAGADVSGKVTVRLVNVDWQQALDVILRINGMGYEIDGNIIRVAPLTKLAAEQQARQTAKDREQEREKKAREDAQKERDDALKAEKALKIERKQAEPMIDAVISVNYAKAADVVKNLDRLKTQGHPDVSIAVDDRTNKLIIHETAAALARMKALLDDLDRPTPQVMIEARLIEATRNFSQSLGIEWGFSGNAQMANLQQPPVSIFSSTVGTANTVPGTPVPLAISFPATT